MARQRKKQYLISYDIAHPKRLGQTHRILKKAGLPLQYSVFTVVLSQTRLERLLTAIEKIIDPRKSIRSTSTNPSGPRRSVAPTSPSRNARSSSSS